VPVGVTGHRPPNPAAQGPSWTPRTKPSPSQLTHPWTQGANGGQIGQIRGSWTLCPLIAQLAFLGANWRSRCDIPMI
jgi:hypothetical protein